MTLAPKQSLLPPKLEREMQPILRALNALDESQRGGLLRVEGQFQLSSLTLLAGFHLIHLNAAHEREAREGQVGFAHAIGGARPEPCGPRAIPVALDAYAILSKNHECEANFASLVARFQNGSLQTGIASLSSRQSLPFLPKSGGAYLDLACGPLAGKYLSEKFKTSGVKLTLLDNSEQILAISRSFAAQVELSDRISTCNADVCDCPALFENASFDVVHFRQPNACFSDRGRPVEDLNLAKLLELVRPGGYFVLGYYPGSMEHVMPDLRAAREILRETTLEALCEFLDAGSDWKAFWGCWDSSAPWGGLVPKISASMGHRRLGSRSETLVAVQRPA